MDRAAEDLFLPLARAGGRPADVPEPGGADEPGRGSGWKPELAVPVTVTSEPSGATLEVNGREVGVTPWTDLVTPGPADLRLTLQHYKKATERVRFAPQPGGGVQTVRVPLAANFGTVSVPEPAGAEVWLDGARVGVAPWTSGKLNPTAHEVEVRLGASHHAAKERFRLEAGEERTVRLAPRPRLGAVQVLVVGADGGAVKAEVRLDGRVVGRSPLVLEDVLVGRHSLEARDPGGTLPPATAVVEVAERATARQVLRFAAPPAARDRVGVPSEGRPLSAGRGEIVEWVRIPGGTFEMGSTEGDGGEKPVHRVRVEGFEIAKSEVTVAQYQACVAAGACSAPHWDDGTCWMWNGSKWEEGVLPSSFRGAEQPVVCVDWEQAVAFSRWVGGRLPSESEWEYAARSGGRSQRYPWGDAEATCRLAVMHDGGNGCGRQRTWPVCSKPGGHSSQGVCDLAGNVWEWVEDCWHGDYSGAPSDGRAWTSGCTGSIRVGRGGSWDFTASSLRAAYRLWSPPGSRLVNLGFRPLRSIP